MPFFKKILFSILISSLLFFFLLLTFLWWNHYPPLPRISHPDIISLDTSSFTVPKYLKTASYNIHFGIGLKWNRKDKLTKQDFLQRLDRIAQILQEINADIVLLQEVDFNSARSKNIDQALYLAEKAGYGYIAKATYLKEKFHPNLQGMNGCIDFGLCILSRFPLSEPEARIFPYPDEMPFYLKWIYNPHGAQKVVATIGEQKVQIINVHLEPWSQKTRQKESSFLASWINRLPGPLILGGDFNALPPEISEKKGYYLSDMPWFIKKQKQDITKDQTIQIIRNIQGMSDIISADKYLQNKSYTFPADNPKERLDYIFARKEAKIVHGYVYQHAETASDHLPIAAYVRYLPYTDIRPKIQTSTELSLF